MNRKLTLMLEENAIYKAKKYADKHKETLSGMVEKYFNFLTTKESELITPKLPPELEELIGIIEVPKNMDIKEEYRRHRAEKAMNG